jgi:colicin import membrane protein
VKERTSDTVEAIIAAVVLHAVLFLLMYFGLPWFNPAPVNPAGSPIEAELIDPNALSASMRRALASRPAQPQPQPAPPEEVEAAPQEQPIPEKRPEDSPEPQQQAPQAPIVEPDVREQEAASAQANTPKPPAPKEQEEKRRQEQIDVTEQERQLEAERVRRLSKMEQDRLAQLADVRKQREQNRREANLAEQKLRQLADARSAADAAAQSDASASPPPGNNGPNDNLRAQYYAAIADAIRQNWNRPENISGGQMCPIRIRQVPGGEVIDVEVLPSCPYDDQGKRSVEAAVLKAQPLPYAGFESVFSRDLSIRFRPNDE